MNSVEQLNVPVGLHTVQPAKSESTAILCGEEAVGINPALCQSCMAVPPARTTGLVKVDLLGLCLLWLSQARQGQQ